MVVKYIYKNGSISATALTDFYAKKILCLIIIAATTIDGLKPLHIEKPTYAELAIKGKNIFKIILYYNYQEEDYMTNRFYDCFIHAIDEDGKKRILYEGW
jgi:hypothetical protein